MRLSLFAFAAAVALTISGCDSTGIDTTVGSDTDEDGGGTTGGGTGGGGTTGGGSTPALTFAPVNPAATYLRTDQSTADATPFLLADYGLTPGERVCFRTVGDFYYAPGLLASTRGEALATGVFSASNVLNATTERIRVKDAIDGDWDMYTRPTYGTAAETNIDEDFEVTDDCWTVPAGATHLFLSAYDDSFLDNSDANAAGQAFGVFVTGSN
ncbi:MAG TPA: hypothetical protein VGB53_12185 [Rubricoccaceae bacterium]|jgi:hypothetical protein